MFKLVRLLVANKKRSDANKARKEKIKEEAERKRLTEREKMQRNAVVLGELTIKGINEKGIETLTLNELTLAERVLNDELIAFTPKAVGWGGNWARVHDTLGVIQKRIALIKGENMDYYGKVTSKK